MGRVEHFIPGVNPVLLGGDFNIDRFRNAGVENFLYQSIIDAGFVDTYAESTVDNLDHLCNYEDGPDEHCTYGVSAFDLPDGGEIGRIDYIFQRGFGVTSYGEVFFNPVASPFAPLDYVSDRSAVLVKMQLPPFLITQNKLYWLVESTQFCCRFKPTFSATFGRYGK